MDRKDSKNEDQRSKTHPAQTPNWMWLNDAELTKFQLKNICLINLNTRLEFLARIFAHSASLTDDTELFYRIDSKELSYERTALNVSLLRHWNASTFLLIIIFYFATTVANEVMDALN